MKYYEPSTIIKLPDAERMSAIRRRYRQALLSIGKSPDYHLFDLTPEFLAGIKNAKTRNFLIKLSRYFDSLDGENKRIFIMDVLESGRHYPFWYMDAFPRRDYERRLRSVVSEVPSCLGA